jgi:hypothetical protein
MRFKMALKHIFFAAERLRILSKFDLLSLPIWFVPASPLPVVFPLFGLEIRVEQPILFVYLIAMPL